MNNMWMQIIGTSLIGGWLLNRILFVYMTMFGCNISNKQENNLFLSLGGKIGRKWFFFNVLISFVALIILTLLAVVFRNWVMFFILIPHFVALFVLTWGNVYKRLNSITDSHNFSLIATILFVLFALSSNNIYSLLPPEIVLFIACVVLLVHLLMFTLPAKKNTYDNEANL